MPSSYNKHFSAQALLESPERWLVSGVGSDTIARNPQMDGGGVIWTRSKDLEFSGGSEKIGAPFFLSVDLWVNKAYKGNCETK